MSAPRILCRRCKAPRILSQHAYPLPARVSSPSTRILSQHAYPLSARVSSLSTRILSQQAHATHVTRGALQQEGSQATCGE
eukprot:2434088-Rhodomonas_salina.1